MATRKPVGKKRRKTKKRRSPLAIVLTAFLILLVLTAGGATWLVLHSLNKIQRVDTEKEVWIAPEFESFESDEQEETPVDAVETNIPVVEEIQWERPTEAKQSPRIHNILLIGQDRRPGEVRARSDSMILCSINEDTNQITLCSLMRDMYVPFPGGYSDNRINAAYTFGGMSLLDQLIKDDFGVTIDGNVEVDFDGFIAVMDLIAPLDIELTDPEAWYLNEGTDWMLRTGVNSLNGIQLLRYARMRHVGNGDFERTERQRKVLNKAFAKVKGMSVAQLTELANAALPCVTTDLTNAEILKYVYMVGANRMSIGGNFRLPAEGTYYPTMIRGMSVLVPDLAKNSELVREYLYD